jgi:hypothetical protein
MREDSARPESLRSTGNHPRLARPLDPAKIGAIPSTDRRGLFPDSAHTKSWWAGAAGATLDA